MAYLLDNTKHHRFIAVPGVHLEQLLHLGEKLRALLHFIVDLKDQ